MGRAYLLGGCSLRLQIRVRASFKKVTATGFQWEWHQAPHKIKQTSQKGNEIEELKAPGWEPCHCASGRRSPEVENTAGTSTEYVPTNHVARKHPDWIKESSVVARRHKWVKKLNLCSEVRALSGRQRRGPPAHLCCLFPSFHKRSQAPFFRVTEEGGPSFYSIQHGFPFNWTRDLLSCSGGIKKRGICFLNPSTSAPMRF